MPGGRRSRYRRRASLRHSKAATPEPLASEPENLNGCFGRCWSRDWAGGRSIWVSGAGGVDRPAEARWRFRRRCRRCRLARTSKLWAPSARASVCLGRAACQVTRLAASSLHSKAATPEPEPSLPREAEARRRCCPREWSQDGWKSESSGASVSTVQPNSAGAAVGVAGGVHWRGLRSCGRPGSARL